MSHTSSRVEIKLVCTQSIDESRLRQAARTTNDTASLLPFPIPCGNVRPRQQRTRPRSQPERRKKRQGSATYSLLDPHRNSALMTPHRGLLIGPPIQSGPKCWHIGLLHVSASDCPVVHKAKLVQCPQATMSTCGWLLDMFEVDDSNFKQITIVSCCSGMSTRQTQKRNILQPKRTEQRRGLLFFLTLTKRIPHAKSLHLAPGTEERSENACTCASFGYDVFLTSRS